MEENELQRALPVGTILKSPKFDYRIEAVLGQGGFGITYKVSTTVMFDKVPIFTYFTIKEHFMKDACERDASGGVGYSKPLQSRVEESRGDFLAEARRLNEISGKNPNVVPVSEVFEANNTVYYVMEYLNGGTLRDELRPTVRCRSRLRSTLSFRWLRRLRFCILTTSIISTSSLRILCSVWTIIRVSVCLC